MKLTLTKIAQVMRDPSAMKRIFTPEQLKIHAKMAKGLAVTMGRRGGNKTKRRGAAYFKRIAAKRKTFAGGRPPKPRCRKCGKTEARCKCESK